MQSFVADVFRSLFNFNNIKHIWAKRACLPFGPSNGRFQLQNCYIVLYFIAQVSRVNDHRL